MHRKLTLVLLAALLAAPAFAQKKPAAKKPAPRKKTETIILDTFGFARCFFVIRPPVVNENGKLEKVDLKTRWLNRETSPPPAHWREVDFDDSAWYRGAGVFQKRARRDVGPNPPPVALACRRMKFNVTDPGRVGDLRLTVRYRGGIVLYLNGTEIARGHLPKGNLTPDTLAEEYPLETHLKPDGSPLVWTQYYESKEVHRRLALRIRKIENLPVPKRLLRKGKNVLAIELHRSPYHPKAITKGPRGRSVVIPWGTCGLADVRMTASTPEGIVPNVARPKGVQVWNSSVLTSDFDQDYGDVSEPLHAIRLVGTRGGFFSGKVVIGSDAPIEGLRAVVGPLVDRKRGSVIPASGVQVRYALPWGYEYGSGGSYPLPVGRFDALSPTPPEVVEVRTKQPRSRRQKLSDIVPRPVFGAICPVWVTVHVPADARPGDYRGELLVTVSGERVAVAPIELTVSAWKLPPATAFHTFTEFIQSPDTLAIAFETPLWSPKHWRLIEQSLRHLGTVGARTCTIPLIAETNQGNAESMVRWVKKPDGGWTYDFSIMERYLDLVEKHQGRPKILSVVVWDIFLEGGRYGSERHMPKHVKEARKESAGQGPEVTVLDVVTGKTSKLTLPEQSKTKSRALWKPLIDETMHRLRRRGYDKEIVFAFTTDSMPTNAVAKLYTDLAPGVPWMRQAHSGRKSFGGHPLAYQALVWSARFPSDPETGRSYGWRQPTLVVQFPRRGMDGYPMVSQRLFAEMNIAGSQRGFGRLGGDTWHVMKDARGRRVARITEGRFPEATWRALNIVSAYLAPGPEGPVATTRLEMVREGLQECEARIFIEKALLDEKRRAKLPGALVARAQKLLDERTIAMLRGMNPFTFKEHFTGNAAANHIWWSRPGGLGSQWFVSSGWQQRSEKLFTTAAEIDRILGSE